MDKDLEGMFDPWIDASDVDEIVNKAYKDRLQAFHEQIGIEHNEAANLGHITVKLHSDGSLVLNSNFDSDTCHAFMSAQEAYNLLDFLYTHRDALREATHKE